MSSLHPYLQLQVGVPPTATPISTIPPEHLLGLTYTSSLGSLFTMQARLLDPTYSSLEELLILSDRKKEPLYFRFGYLDHLGSANGLWLQTRLVNFVPRLTSKGMEITLDAIADIRDKNAHVTTKAYSGKISDVVKQVAADMDLDTEIEETDDDWRVAAGSDAESAIWRVSNEPLMLFLKELAQHARSKTGSKNYSVFLSGTRTQRRRPVLHFHTRTWACSHRKKPIKRFTYLAGQDSQVLDFQPSYDSAILGEIGAAGVAGRVYDPETKRWVEYLEDMTNNSDVQASTPDLVNSREYAPDRTFVAGVLAKSAKSPEDHRALVKNTFRYVMAAQFAATIELLGLPDNQPGSAGVGTGTVDIEADDLIEVTVMIPNQPHGNGASFKKHWSSGLYVVHEAVHQIESNYTVTCQLERYHEEMDLT